MRTTERLKKDPRNSPLSRSNCPRSDLNSFAIPLQTKCALGLIVCQVALTCAYEELVDAGALRADFNRGNRLPERVGRSRIYSRTRLGAGQIRFAARPEF